MDSRRAAVLIDGMYLQNILNEFALFGKVNYEKFSDKLVGEDHYRSRTYLFDALPPEGAPARENKQRFLDKLKYLDKFQVELGYVRLEHKTCPLCNQAIAIPRQKKVDILLSTRLLDCCFDDKIDRLIIVAGDGDFVPAIEAARKKKEIALAYADTSKVGAATQLKQACDLRIQLDKGFFEECKL